MTPEGYEIAPIEGFLARFEREVPDAVVWPTAAVRQLLEEALTISGIVTEVAYVILDYVPRDVAPAVEIAVEPMFEAGAELVPFARTIGAETGSEVAIPGFKAAYVRLLRGVVIAWRELAFLESIRPWFLRFSKERVRELDGAARRMSDLADVIWSRGVPEAPPEPVPMPPSPPMTRRRIHPAVGVVAIASAGVIGVGLLGLVSARLRAEQGSR